MARSRNIKPGFFTNDELAECSPFARLLFAGLWTIADKEGRLDDRPKKVKAMVLPFDDVDCNDLLQQLHNHKFINRYQVNNEPYIQINNWKKHQNPHCKEAASEIPEPAKNDESTGQEQCKPDEDAEKEDTVSQQVIENEGAQDKNSSSTVLEQEQHTTNPADSLNLIPDSLNLNTENRDPRFDLSLSDVNTRLSMAGLKNISQHDLNILLIQLQDAYSHKKQMVKNQILGKAFEWIKRQQETPLKTPGQSITKTTAQILAEQRAAMDRQQGQIIDVGEPKKSLLIEGVGRA